MSCGENCCLPGLSSAQMHGIAQHMRTNSWDSHCLSKALLSLKSIYLCYLPQNVVQNPVCFPLAFLAFRPVTASPSLSLSPSPHLPSFLKFPNKSRQIDTYLSPPPSLASCPFSCSGSTGGAIIN